MHAKATCGILGAGVANLAHHTAHIHGSFFTLEMPCQSHLGMQQATLVQVDRAFALPVAPPATGLKDAKGVARGGVSVAGGLRLAEFLGGRDSQANLPLFNPGAVFTRRFMTNTLSYAASTMLRPDAFSLTSQPYDWRGAANPMRLSPGEGWLLRTLVTRPLSEMEQASARLAEGDDSPLPEPRNAPRGIFRLARAFNAMKTC